MSELKPQRIQLRRTKGWRMPENVVKVTRPGFFGNPFTVTRHIAPGKCFNGNGHMSYIAVPTVDEAIECFREYARLREGYVERVKQELRGKNLGCWCKLGDCCHGDVLLEIANADTTQSETPVRQPILPTPPETVERGMDTTSQANKRESTG